MMKGCICFFAGSNAYLQDSCSDTELGDTDSFGSRLSGNGSSSGVAGAGDSFKHVKEEIENDEDYFRLLANQSRGNRSFEGKLTDKYF